MVTCTTPFRAAVRLNSGVSAQMKLRNALSVLLTTLGVCCFAFTAWVVASAANEFVAIPAVNRKDSLLSFPALIIPVFCGLVILAAAQRVRTVYPPSTLDER